MFPLYCIWGQLTCNFLLSCPESSHGTLFNPEIVKKHASAGPKQAGPGPKWVSRGFQPKPLRADDKAQKIISLVVFDPKWVAMAPFGLRIGQNESEDSERHQDTC